MISVEDDAVENVSIGAVAVTAKVVNVASGGTYAPIAGVADVFAKSQAKKRERAKCEYIDQLVMQYQSANVIDGFYGETDRDTAIYVMEEKYAPLSLQSNLVSNGFKKEFEYRELLRLFKANAYSEKSKTSLNHIIFDEETKKRIALAYICARKVIRGSTSIENGLPTGITLSISPECPVEYLSEMKIDGDNSDKIKLRKLYYAVLLEIMYVGLLIEGFEPKFARKEVIEKLKRLFENGFNSLGGCGALYNLKPEDMRNLRFDLQTYA